MKIVRARWFTEGRTAPVRVIVCHDMEAPEKATTAEAVANYFATTSTKASAHVCVDSDSAVRCVDDGDTAWAAPGCNNDGLQLEIAGYMRQTRAQWMDDYSKAALGQAAKVAAAWAKKYSIPVKHLTVAELKAGKRGFVGHVDVSDAYHRTDHGDPGPGFPWDYFLGLVLAEMDWMEALVRKLPTLREGAKGEDVQTLRGLLLARNHPEIGPVEGPFDAKVTKAVKALQTWGGVDDDGVVGPDTWPILMRAHV